MQGLAGALGIARATNNRPALRQRIDLTFRIGGGAKRFSVIEVRAAIPLAVPGLLLDVLLQLLGLGEATLGKGSVVASARQFCKLGQHVVQEESQPNAFAATLVAHQIHPVVPVAATHERQAMLAEFKPVFDGANAMLIQRGRRFGAIGQVIV